MSRRDAPSRCHFCGRKDVLLDGIGIAIGMGGSYYAFCEDCLRYNSAYKFWFNFFDTLGYEFPGEDEDWSHSSGPIS